MPERSEPYFLTPALYDRVYAPFTDDVPYWIERAREARGPVLEVACGNGRVLIPLLEAGIVADGLDFDPAMLTDARVRIERKGLQSRLYPGDMRDFTLPQRYAMILIAFNSFLHNLTLADQLATLRCCREHLDPGGALLLSVFSPDPAMMARFDGSWRTTFEHADPSGPGRIRVLESTVSDPVAQRNENRRRVEVLDAEGGVVERHEMEFPIRWVWKNEMDLLLRTAGFHDWEVEGHTRYDRGFTRTERPAPGDVLVWTAWR